MANNDARKRTALRLSVQKIPCCYPETFPEDETFDIGRDTRTGVALLEYRYDVPFKFTGKIDKLTFKLEPEKDTKAKQ